VSSVVALSRYRFMFRDVAGGFELVEEGSTVTCLTPIIVRYFRVKANNNNA